MSQQEIDQLVDQDYKYGFVTDIESDTLPPGLNEDVIREISTRKGEPEWLLEWRLEAYAKWLTMTPPDWAHVDYPPIDFQSISYFSAPKKQGDGPQSLDEVDPALIDTYNKLGIPLEEQKMLAGVAVDAVFDSVSVVTTFTNSGENHYRGHRRTDGYHGVRHRRNAVSTHRPLFSDVTVAGIR